jgi:hypothetical protein
MATRYSTGLFKSICVTASLRATMLNGIIEFFSGGQPASPDDAASGTLLARITINGDAFVAGVSTNGINLETDITISGADAFISKESTEVWKMKVLAAGTVGWYRYKANAADNDLSSTTLPRIDGTVALAGTSGDSFKLPNLTLVTVGQLVTIDQYDLLLVR